jgi:NitT/TauT family transport system substrate-binding protein
MTKPTDGFQQRRRILKTISAAAVAGCLPLSASAQTRTIRITGPGNAEFVPVIVAQERGIFAKHGLKATITIAPTNTTVPALQSRSMDIAMVGASSLLLFVDSGLDLVVVSGGAIGSKSDRNYGIVAKKGSTIRTPQDFIGKKIAVPGLVGFFHILGREWLHLNKVNDRRVTFVESTLPAQNDLLRAGTVDAIATTEPFLSRALANGAGERIFHIAADLPQGLPPFLYATTRSWAKANVALARSFKASLAEAIVFAEKNAEQARADFGKYIKLPPDALATMKFNKMSVDLPAQSLALWVDMLKRQGLIRGDKDVRSLFVS